MKTPDWYVFKDCLDMQSPQEKSSLMHYLVHDLKDEMQETPNLPFHPSKKWLSYKERLRSIHYSWFIPYLESYSDQDKYLFISVLDEEQQESLSHHLQLFRSFNSMRSEVEPFFAKLLYVYLLDGEDILPQECLPEDPLNGLLSLSRDQLLTLVDFLSLHDLSLEIKTLVNASHLVKIHTLLSQKQKEYLYKLNHRIEPIAFRSMRLNEWNGDLISLKKTLHQRGLNRLAKGLSESNPSLFWHLIHKLDIGRASIVKTLFKELKNKKAHSILVSQICDLLPAL